MVAQFVGHLSSTDLQKQLLLQASQHTNPSTTAGAWMWAGRRASEEDDSRADRAFAEDTGNIMGTTWPPRSYTCTFCRREFRSAQALGGHMNVHRRDRARMRQSPPRTSSDQAPLTTSSPSPPVFTAQELVANGGLCLFYPFPAHGHVYPPHSPPSTLLSISPYATSTAGYMAPSCSPSIPPSMFESSLPSVSKGLEDIKTATNDQKVVLQYQEAAVEELDLELRLGNKRS